jgi:excisionase family DNA binding protein
VYTFNLIMAGSADWMSVEEAAEYLRKSTHWLYQNRVKQGIPHVQVGGTYRFHKSQLDEWLKTRTTQVHSATIARKPVRKISL